MSAQTIEFPQVDQLVWRYDRWDGDPNKSLLLDSADYLSLVLSEMRDRGESIDGRSPYERGFLQLAAQYQLEQPTLQDNALRMLVLADDVLVPGIDVHSHMYRESAVRYPRGFGMKSAVEPQLIAQLAALGPFIVRHPLARIGGLTLARYDRLVEEWSKSQFWGRTMGDDPGSSLAAMLVFETLMVHGVARDEGTPAASRVFADWAGGRDERDQDVLLEIWFDHAVYSPQPRTIGEALDLRGNPRVEQWRHAMRDWAQALSAGTTTPAEIVERIKEANGYLEGARGVGGLLPTWSTLVIVPLAFVAHHLGLDWLAAGLSVVKGINFYGKLVKMAVQAKTPTKNGWYLLDTK